MKQLPEGDELCRVKCMGRVIGSKVTRGSMMSLKVSLITVVETGGTRPVDERSHRVQSPVT